MRPDQTTNSASKSSERELLPIFMPDALIDSNIRRTIKARRRLGDGQGLLPRLLIASNHALQWAIVPLGPGDLYCHEVNRNVRSHARAILGGTPAWLNLERGRNGNLHLNILFPVGIRLVLPRRSALYQVDPKTAFDLLRYLSKPPDARVCDYKDPKTGMRYRPTEQERRAALDDYIQAKKRCHPGTYLPRLSWTHKLPRLKPDAIPGIH